MSKNKQKPSFSIPSDDPELKTFSVTIGGSVVPQEWPQAEEYIGDDLSWEDLIPETLLFSNTTEFRIDSELRAA
jgi:hypothetical protein